MDAPISQRDRSGAADARTGARDFAERATVGILFGLMGVVAFALVYAAVARRTNWGAALLVAVVAFFVVSASISLTGWGLLGAALAAYAALVLAVVLIPRPSKATSSVPPPWWDLWFRMGTAALLTLAITAVADRLGPTFSGIIATFPVVSSVIVTVTHHQMGPAAATAMLRGSVLSWASFASCFLTIGLTLPSYGLGASLLLGAASVVATSVLVLMADRMASARRAS